MAGWLAGWLVGWLERNLLNFGRNVLGGCNFGGGLRPSPYSTLLLVFAAQTHEATIFISKNGSTAHTFPNKIKKSDASGAHRHDVRHHEKRCKSLITPWQKDPKQLGLIEERRATSVGPRARVHEIGSTRSGPRDRVHEPINRFRLGVLWY